MAQLTIDSPEGSSCRARRDRAALVWWWMGCEWQEAAIARHRCTVSEDKGWRGRVVKMARVEWHSDGDRGVGRKRWAGLVGLYGTGLQHSARTRLALCTASKGHT